MFRSPITAGSGYVDTSYQMRQENYLISTLAWYASLRGVQGSNRMSKPGSNRATRRFTNALYRDKLLDYIERRAEILTRHDAISRRWKRVPHSRLSCRHQRHWFCKSQQNLTLKHHRFPFSTSPLAECGDCSLLRLHLLVLSHVLPCELYARSFFRTVSRLSLQSRTHFCLIILSQLLTVYPTGAIES